MAKKDRSPEKEPEVQEAPSPVVGGPQPSAEPPVDMSTPTVPPPGRSPDSETQTSPHKLRDSLGTPVQGSPSGGERRGARNVGAYNGPERRKS